jgi:hypothetical protein
MTRSQQIEGRARGRALRRIAAVAGLACLLACATPHPPAALGADATVTKVFAIVVDHPGGRVYWANLGNDTVSSVSLDGSDARNLNTTGATIVQPRGLALDPVARRLYWINWQLDGQAVGYANLDDSGGANLPPATKSTNFRNGLVLGDGVLYWLTGFNQLAFQAVAGQPDGVIGVGALRAYSGIAIDSIAKRVYWFDQHSPPQFLSAALDGSDVRAISTAGATLLKPAGLAIDQARGRIYWANAGARDDQADISFAKLDGSGGGDLPVRGYEEIEAFAVDPVTGRIYWGNFLDNSISTAASDGSGIQQFFPRVDATLRAPVIDDAPPASTPLSTADLLFHAVDGGVTLSCTLDGAAASSCTSPKSFRGLAVGVHCFSVREQRNGLAGPSTRTCWTVTQLADGCTASFHHGYFITAGAAMLGRRTVIFHATADVRHGNVALATRSSTAIRVRYLLDGKRLASGTRYVLPFARIDRARPHTLAIDVSAAGRHARIARHFRYVSYVSTACGGRTLVGRIPPRTISIGDAHITITASVPREIRGTDKLRVHVASERSGSLRGVDFTLDGRAVRHHARSVALTAQQLDDDTRVLSIVLHPTHGSDVTVRIPLRTRATA